MICPLESRGGEASLVEFVAGKVRGPAGALLRAHVDNCRPCGEYVAEQRTIWRLLDDWEPEFESFGFDNSFASRLAKLSADPWLIRTGRFAVARLLKPAFTVTAVTALLAVSIYVRNPFAGLPAVAISHPVQHTTKTVSRVISRLEAEQMDRTIDDLQLLHQLDSLSEGHKEPSRSM